MKTIKIKNKHFIVDRLLFLLLVSVFLGWGTVELAKLLPIFSSSNTRPDFFMNHFFTSMTNKYPVSTKIDKNDSIVILDVSSLKREQLAEMLTCLDSQSPKVIGFDVLHQYPNNPNSDFLLSKTIKECKSSIVLPVYVDENGATITSFYVDSMMMLGSVVFDDPWHNRPQHGKYKTFAYQIASLFRNQVFDTTVYIVDYTPVSFSERILFDDSSKMFRYEDLNNHRNPNLEGKIVLVGTIDRTIDAIDLDFPVAFHDDYKANNCIPGMIALAYQIQSFIEDSHHIKKMTVLGNVFLCIFFLVVYICLFLLVQRGENWLFNNAACFWKLLPVLKIIVFIAIEFSLIALIIPIVNIFKTMPNLWIAMAALPYVNATNIVFSRLFDNNNK